jgi:hypothetical protein
MKCSDTLQYKMAFTTRHIDARAHSRGAISPNGGTAVVAWAATAAQARRIPNTEFKKDMLKQVARGARILSRLGELGTGRRGEGVGSGGSIQTANEMRLPARTHK